MARQRHGTTSFDPPSARAAAAPAARAVSPKEALDQARRLDRERPGPDSRDRLRKAYLTQIQALRAEGRTRDAQALVEEAVRLNDPDPGWRTDLAEQAAGMGRVGPALAMLNAVADESARGRVLAQAADYAVRLGAKGKSHLPDALHAEFDAVIKAFDDSAAGRDEAVAAGLQAVGLRSPFAEWKLFLRGLQAYYANDDTRATENWQRLSPARLPARLAAPLRLQIDPGFKNAQPEPTRQLLARQAEQFTGPGIGGVLRQIRAAMASDDNLRTAFRLAEGVLPALRKDHPDLARRLANSLYWALLHPGQPDDVPKYQRLFGPHPDDPTFARLRALGYEHGNSLTEAHKHWQEFDKAVADGKVAWAAPHLGKVRALVWARMGENAARRADEVADADAADMPVFFRFDADRPRPLTPGPVECFTKSTDLDPTNPGPAAALFNWYVRDEKPKQAIEAGRELLRRFPDHFDTLLELSSLLTREQDHAGALDLLQRAVKINPLRRDLRESLGLAQLGAGRGAAAAAAFDDARRHLEAAGQSLVRPGAKSAALCAWAACELKAKAPDRAEDLRRQALAAGLPAACVAFNMVTETTPLKLPPAARKPFETEFADALKAPPDPDTLAGWLQQVNRLRHFGADYRGFKTHEKKVLDSAKKAVAGAAVRWTETALEEVVAVVVALKAKSLSRQAADLGKRLFPDSPFFLFIGLSTILSGERASGFVALEDVRRAIRLVDALPPEHRHRVLAEPLRVMKQQLEGMNPFLSQLFGGRFDDEDVW